LLCAEWAHAPVGSRFSLVHLDTEELVKRKREREAAVGGECMAKTRAAGALASVVVSFRFGGGVAVIVCAIFGGVWLSHLWFVVAAVVETVVVTEIAERRTL